MPLLIFSNLDAAATEMRKIPTATHMVLIHLPEIDHFDVYPATQNPNGQGLDVPVESPDELARAIAVFDLRRDLRAQFQDSRNYFPRALAPSFGLTRVDFG